MGVEGMAENEASPIALHPISAINGASCPSRQHHEAWRYRKPSPRFTNPAPHDFQAPAHSPSADSDVRVHCAG